MVEADDRARSADGARLRADARPSTNLAVARALADGSVWRAPRRDVVDLTRGGCGDSADRARGGCGHGAADGVRRSRPKRALLLLRLGPSRCVRDDVRGVARRLRRTTVVGLPAGARGHDRVPELRLSAASMTRRSQSFMRRWISSRIIVSASWGTTSQTTRSTTSRESAMTASACCGVRPRSPSLPAS